MGMMTELILRGGRVVNVYTREILAQDVAIAGGKIVYVGSNAGSFEGPSTAVLDITGKVVVPGFVDGHTHVDAFLTIPSFLQAVFRTGTTAIFTEIDAVASAFGLEGVRWFLDAIAGQPVKVFAMAPTISYLTTDDGTGAPIISHSKMKALRDDPRIVALGEVYWPHLLSGDRGIEDLVTAYREVGKRIEGHSAGARGRKLVAFAAAGVTSCHEATTAEEAADLLRLGLFVFLREGSIRRDLQETLRIREMGIALDRVGLASDGVWPDALVDHGYMDAVVQRAIDLGVDPMTAFQMASVNVARYFGFEDRFGGIAPNRDADVIVIPSEREIRPETVISKGRVLVRDGDVVANARAHGWPPGAHGLIQWPEPVEPGMFRYAAPGPRHRVRAMRFAGDIRTREEILEIAVRDGELVIPDGACMAAVFQRTRTERYGLGLITGFGLERGAVGSTLSLESSDVVVIGRDAVSMATTVKQLGSMGGGIVVCANERVLAELRLPIGGVASDEPASTVGQSLKGITAALRELGVTLPRPILSVPYSTSRLGKS
jgi:adenine deaminase